MTRSGKSHSAQHGESGASESIEQGGETEETMTTAPEDQGKAAENAESVDAPETSTDAAKPDSAVVPQPQMMDANGQMYPMYPGMIPGPYGPRSVRGQMPRPFYPIPPGMRAAFVPPRVPLAASDTTTVAKTGTKRTASVSEEGGLDSEDDKKRRNRAAAQRCRVKKKKQVAELESKSAQMVRENTELRNNQAKLLEEISQLKSLIMEHRRTCTAFNATPSLPPATSSNNGTPSKDSKSNSPLLPITPRKN